MALGADRGLERDNWSPRDPRWRNLGQLDGDFGIFSAIPSRCSRRSISRHTSSGRTPRTSTTRKIVQKVGASLTTASVLPLTAVDHRLRWLFGQVSSHLGGGRAGNSVPFAKPPDRDPWPRGLPDKAVERITHVLQNNPKRLPSVLTDGACKKNPSARCPAD